MESGDTFYEWCAQGELRLQRCGQCREWCHMPRVICPSCSAQDWAWERVGELENDDKAALAEQWRMQIERQNYDWMSANLTMHYSAEKMVALGQISKKWASTGSRKQLDLVKSRLVTLGWYIQLVNEE